MDESVNPILRYVREAREYGKIGNYSSCFQSYSSAKELIQQELKKCRNISEHKIWNSLTSEIVSEELAVRRLRDAIDDTLEALRGNDNKLIKSEEVTASKPDFSIVSKVIDFNPEPAPRRNYRRLPNLKHASFPREDEGPRPPRQQPQSQCALAPGPQRSPPKVDPRNNSRDKNDNN